ncbi:MAG TPA: RNA polymerase sigma factor [Bryobacteraceae bacterium]|nr:RNA polymerase sigma factor [Bryobacteraceae bacterium]
MTTARAIETARCEMDDVLERFTSGDAEAFEALFRRYQGEVYRWIVRIVRNPAVAEELTVETFWRIYRQRRRFDAQRQFGPWARRIATRAAIDYLRSEGPALELRVPIAQIMPDTTQNDEMRGLIEQAFYSLPARLRAAATLALIEELPYQEIAAALDISVSAVKMRVARAARQLRDRLEEMGIRP